MNKAQKATQETQAARAAESLRKYYKPGSTAFTMLTHRSSNGMMRHIALIGVDPKTKEPVNLSSLASDVLGWKMNKACDSVLVGGCGMDMGFHLVYSLSSHLYNGVDRKGKKDTRGSGYAISHRWL